MNFVKLLSEQSDKGLWMQITKQPLLLLLLCVFNSKTRLLRSLWLSVGGSLCFILKDKNTRRVDLVIGEITGRWMG